MNEFDCNFIFYFNHFVNRWHGFDQFMGLIADSAIVNGLVLVLMAWYLLFDLDSENHSRPNIEALVATILLSPVAVLLARLIALALPFRRRPLWTPELHFQLPIGIVPVLRAWSSFPSDHAVLFFMLAAGISFVSRALGVLAFLWVTVFVCFPRIYLGYHWPTDIVAGAILGIAMALITRIPSIQSLARKWTLSWRREHSGLYMAGLFFMTYEITQLFSNTKVAGWIIVHLTGHH